MNNLNLILGDITQLKVDAIVNAANPSLSGGGGVDGAIHLAGGPAILEECRQIREKQGGCPAGEAVITTSGNMPSGYVIHTVGPVWRGGGEGEARLLRSCYLKSLELADAYELKTIAFPNISTGVYGYPRESAALVAVQAVKDYLDFGTSNIEEVVFVCFDDRNYSIYQQLLNL
jgi:O-acetyl-ADP-ribose deacetylase (regulator of RNase III)